MHRALRLPVALLALGLLASVGPAKALLIETPLRLTADQAEAEVGDAVAFTVDASNESAQAEYAGKTVRVVWEAIEEESQPEMGVIQERLALDGKAHATFGWDIPPEAQDKNIFVALKDGDERAGQSHLRVGNATPMAFALGGDGTAATSEPGADPGEPQAGAPGETRQGSNRTPGLEVAALVGGLAAVAVLARRRGA